jgi:homoserine kinase
VIVARVPATSANLGAGFDCLGLALELANDVELVVGGPFHIEVVGEGAESLPRDRSNLVARTVHRFFDQLGRPAPAFGLRLINRIPMTGGLGSSSTALVGGLLCANHLAGEPWSREELLRFAWELEGHPDNVAPAMLGGLVLSVVDAGKLITVVLPQPPGLRAVIFLPRFSTSTREARRLLPARVSHQDAVFNLGRAALFVAAMTTGRTELLRVATQDRLHQPYRQVLFPAMGKLFEAALAAGALGAWLSGSGSALCALTQENPNPVATAFEAAARAHGVAGRTQIVELAREGARIVES